MATPVGSFIGYGTYVHVFDFIGWTETSSSFYTVTDIELKYPLVEDYFFNPTGSPTGTPLFHTLGFPLIKVYKASQTLMSAIAWSSINNSDFQLSVIENAVLGKQIDSVRITGSTYTATGTNASVGISLNKGDTLNDIGASVNYSVLTQGPIRIIGPQPVRG